MMALLDRGLRQRIVGALVLLALAVVFLPMLFSRPDEARDVQVVAPAMPEPAGSLIVTPEPVEPLDIPPLQAMPEHAAESVVPVVEQEPPVVAEVPSSQAPLASGTPVAGLDEAGLPRSWSVQLASLASREGAEALQQKLRAQGYNAYVRSFEGKTRVLVGPVIEKTEAERLRAQLKRQLQLDGFIVRFQPERN